MPKTATKTKSGSLGFVYGGKCLKQGWLRFFVADSDVKDAFEGFKQHYGPYIKGRYVECENAPDSYKRLQTKLKSENVPSFGDLCELAVATGSSFMKEVTGCKKAKLWNVVSGPVDDDGGDGDGDADADDAEEKTETKEPAKKTAKKEEAKPTAGGPKAAKPAKTKAANKKTSKLDEIDEDEDAEDVEDLADTEGESGKDDEPSDADSDDKPTKKKTAVKKPVAKKPAKK